jgi:hypothetical protein
MKGGLLTMEQVPEFKDEAIQCAPEPSGAISPFCFICPGPSGAFGNPFSSKLYETTDPDEILTTFIFCVVFMFEPLLYLFCSFLLFSLHVNARNYEQVDITDYPEATPANMRFSVIHSNK